MTDDQKRKYAMSDVSVPVCKECGRLDYKRRGQRELDELAYRTLLSWYRGPESWVQWSDWLELTKAKRGEQGLGTTTFSDCIKRLIARDKVGMRAVGKNMLYQPVFDGGEPRSSQRSVFVGPIAPEGPITPRSSGVDSPKSGNDHSQESSVVLDKAAEALKHLLNKKLPSGV